jgi:hypothetical protein
VILLTLHVNQDGICLNIYLHASKTLVNTQLLVFVLIMVCSISNRYIPESLRWLVVTGKYQRAEQILLHICEINKAQLPDNINIKEFEDLVSQSE